MDNFGYDAGVARRHAPLVQRGLAIITALGDENALSLGDELCPAAEQRSGVVMNLIRGERPGIRREKGAGTASRVALTYADPASESALSAFLACAAAPGAPIAADPESLSVLALAERLAASDIPVLIGGPTGTGGPAARGAQNTHAARST